MAVEAEQMYTNPERTEKCRPCEAMQMKDKYLPLIRLHVKQLVDHKDLRV